MAWESSKTTLCQQDFLRFGRAIILPCLLSILMAPSFTACGTEFILDQARHAERKKNRSAARTAQCLLASDFCRLSYSECYRKALERGSNEETAKLICDTDTGHDPACAMIFCFADFRWIADKN